MQDTYKLSHEGHKKILKEFQELKETKRKEAVERLSKARAMGDLSENSEYTAARDDLNFIDGRIAEIEEIVRNVELVDEKKTSGVVQIGDTVVVNTNGKKEEFIIVGELEADILARKISDSSPIGKALLGSKIGEEVSVEIPAGKVNYKIVEIK